MAPNPATLPWCRAAGAPGTSARDRAGSAAVPRRRRKSARRRNGRKRGRCNSVTCCSHYTIYRPAGRQSVPVDGDGPGPSFPPALARERFLTADRPRRPEVTARQRDAPSGAKAFWHRPPAGPAVLRKRNLFDSLSERLNAVLDRLTRRGALSEADVEEALREVRRALLEADVALDVARAFTDEVKKRAVGVEVIKSVTPGQMVVKIVHDQLIEILGSDAQPIDLNAPAPVVIMMVGL